MQIMYRCGVMISRDGARDFRKYKRRHPSHAFQTTIIGITTTFAYNQTYHHHHHHHCYYAHLNTIIPTTKQQTPPPFKMQFTTAILASAAALTASALPQNVPIGPDTKFSVVTILPGSVLQNSPVQAARTGLLVNAKSQNASCSAPTNSATFFLQDEELQLYGASATPQTIFVDRSGRFPYFHIPYSLFPFPIFHIPYSHIPHICTFPTREIT